MDKRFRPTESILKEASAKEATRMLATKLIAAKLVGCLELLHVSIITTIAGITRHSYRLHLNLTKTENTKYDED